MTKNNIITSFKEMHKKVKTFKETRDKIKFKDKKFKCYFLERELFDKSSKWAEENNKIITDTNYSRYMDVYNRITNIGYDVTLTLMVAYKNGKIVVKKNKKKYKFNFKEEII